MSFFCFWSSFLCVWIIGWCLCSSFSHWCIYLSALSLLCLQCCNASHLQWSAVFKCVVVTSVWTGSHVEHCLCLVKWKRTEDVMWDLWCVIKAVSAGIWQTLRRWAFVCLSYGFCVLSSHMLQHLKTHHTWTKHTHDSVESDNQEKYTLKFLKCQSSLKCSSNLFLFWKLILLMK